MRGHFRWYQSRRLTVGHDSRSETLYRPFHTRTFLSLILLSHKHSPLVLALFQMADNGRIGGICQAEPGLPKLLILSLERIGVVDPPEYVYREYDCTGTLRCDMMIFVGKSTPTTLTWTPGSSPQLAFASQTPTERPSEKPCDVCVWSTSIISSGLL